MSRTHLIIVIVAVVLIAVVSIMVLQTLYPSDPGQIIAPSAGSYPPEQSA